MKVFVAEMHNYCVSAVQPRDINNLIDAPSPLERFFYRYGCQVFITSLCFITGILFELRVVAFSSVTFY